MNHCIAKIVEIVERGADDRRSILQLGYNLGRLSELTELGREPFWDRWKEPVETWDLPRLQVLVHELQDLIVIPFAQPSQPSIDSVEPR